MYDLRVLFATNFSDSCFRAIRAVAQLADAFRIDITIVHAGEEPEGRSGELNSFFAEADHYACCRRMLLQGTAAEAVSELTRRERFDLVVAPGSDRIGIPRPFHRSLRAEILRRGVAPVWTASRGLEQADFRRPIRTVAAGIDGWDRDIRHVELAAAFAGRIGARVRILTVVPPVDEGTLGRQAVRPQPLHRDVAVERIERLLCHWHHRPEVEVVTGSAGREFPRLAGRCDADVLFLSESQSIGGLFQAGISRTVNQSPCPVIAVPGELAHGFQWTFQLAKAPAVRGELVLA